MGGPARVLRRGFYILVNCSAHVQSRRAVYDVGDEYVFVERTINACRSLTRGDS